MKIIFRPICWCISLWSYLHTVITGNGIQNRFLAGSYVSGHAFIEDEDGNLLCEVCGYMSD